MDKGRLYTGDFPQGQWEMGHRCTFHRESVLSKFPLTTCSDPHNTVKREATGEEGERMELELVCLRPKPTVTEQRGPSSTKQLSLLELSQAVKGDHLAGF